MKKVLNWVKDNPLYICTLIILVFIPLFPKIPLLDVRNTWVYVRVEDFLVIFVLALWLYLLFKKKITLKTPLTLPILIFWAIGLLATFHGVVLIFPQARNVFSNVAFFAYLRHIEYMSLFFVAYSSMKDKKLLSFVIIALLSTFFLTAFYGLGQKYLGFPAYLTMNEEFAKGDPIRLSELSRVPSTFAGHYDYAAYLVLVIPIFASLIFGFKNLIARGILLFSVILGFLMLSMTVSRISFLVVLISLFTIFVIKSRKIALLSIPIVIIGIFVFLSTQPALFSRFGSTVSEVDVLVDAKTGNAIGHVKYVPSENFSGRNITRRVISEGGRIHTESISEDQRSRASPSVGIPLELLSLEVPLVSDVNLSTGENLPQGTGYTNLVLSPVKSKTNHFFYEETEDSDPSKIKQTFIFQGDFLVKRASAYDLSFTTRFQGEWPHAIEAFKKNILIGSGYGSVSLAVDNNFLRMLAETGLLGTVSFFVIFIAVAIYIKKIWHDIDSDLFKSFLIGLTAGVFGLFLNALFIDVFEASKIAFTLWTLTGITVGILVLYQRGNINLINEIKNVLTSSYAVIFYLIAICIFVYFPMINNFFVADDFIWFKWAEDSISPNTVISYFTQSQGFFYRPGTKLYFLLMHNLFWFNQVVYHAVSVLMHAFLAILLFILAKKILRNFYLSILATFIYLLASGYSEMVLWISSTGHIFTSFFSVASLLLFILWDEKRNIVYYLLSLATMTLGLLFHEMGVVVPVLIILFKLYKEEKLSLRILKDPFYLFSSTPVIFYLVMRFLANSHWSGGDYSYNLLKLPFNVLGNLVGYLSLSTFGAFSMPLYSLLRALLRENLILSIPPTLILIIAVYQIGRFIFKKLNPSDGRIIVFGLLFFIISLLPFLGLGNIASRYSYLATFGISLILAVFVKIFYSYLKPNGRGIALLGSGILISIFLMWHVISLQQAQMDWQGAGRKSQRFLTSLESKYNEDWARVPVELHFVDVPIKYGEAWVFPVGLEDAVWFAFKNPNIKVYKHAKEEDALRVAGETYSPIFKLNDDGSLKEIYRPQNEVYPL